MCLASSGPYVATSPQRVLQIIGEVARASRRGERSLKLGVLRGTWAVTWWESISAGERLSSSPLGPTVCTAVGSPGSSPVGELSGSRSRLPLEATATLTDRDRRFVHRRVRRSSTGTSRQADAAALETRAMAGMLPIEALRPRSADQSCEGIEMRNVHEAPHSVIAVGVDCFPSSKRALRWAARQAELKGRPCAS
jgi:hypothetical protein